MTIIEATLFTNIYLRGMAVVFAEGVNETAVANKVTRRPPFISLDAL